MRAIGPPRAANRITPSRFQVPPPPPPNPPGAFPSVCTDPPSTSTRLILRAEKNPRDFPSGDQNGNSAPSVPAITRDKPDVSDRSDNIGCPSDVATNAMAPPSGEIATDEGEVVGGVESSKRISDAIELGR